MFRETVAATHALSLSLSLSHTHTHPGSVHRVKKRHVPRNCCCHTHTYTLSLSLSLTHTHTGSVHRVKKRHVPRGCRCLALYLFLLLTLSLTQAQFTELKEDMFREAVAVSAGLSPETVSIITVRKFYLCNTHTHQLVSHSCNTQCIASRDSNL